MYSGENLSNNQAGCSPCYSVSLFKPGILDRNSTTMENKNVDDTVAPKKKDEPSSALENPAISVVRIINSGTCTETQEVSNLLCIEY